MTIELMEQIVRELEVGLVDLVDEHARRRFGAAKARPSGPRLDVPARCRFDVAVAEAGVVEAAGRRRRR
jgi:hypothetical protein